MRNNLHEDNRMKTRIVLPTLLLLLLLPLSVLVPPPMRLDAADAAHGVASPRAGVQGRPAAQAATERSIRLAYFIPKDRRPAADHERKIRLIMSSVAELYVGDLRAAGCDTDGPQFEGEPGQALVHVVRGARDAAYYNNRPRYDADEQWRRLLPEVRAQLGEPRRRVTVVFAETYDEIGPAEHLWPGSVARGAYLGADGGLAVFSAHLLRDGLGATTRAGLLKLLDDDTPVPGRRAWGHGMNSPRRAFVEDGIGAVAHELGHALGLPHDRRDDARDLMGNGFRNVRRNFGVGTGPRVAFSAENRLLLMSSRYLAKDLSPTDATPPQVDLAAARDGRGVWSVAVKARDDAGLRAIVFVDRGAGTVVAGRKLSGREAEFRQRLPGGAAAGDLDLQVIVTDEGGHQTRQAIKAARGG